MVIVGNVQGNENILLLTQGGFQIMPSRVVREKLLGANAPKRVKVFLGRSVRDVSAATAINKDGSLSKRAGDPINIDVPNLGYQISICGSVAINGKSYGNLCQANLGMKNGFAAGIFGIPELDWVGVVADKESYAAIQTIVSGDCFMFVRNSWGTESGGGHELAVYSAKSNTLIVNGGRIIDSLGYALDNKRQYVPYFNLRMGKFVSEDTNKTRPAWSYEIMSCYGSDISKAVQMAYSNKDHKGSNADGIAWLGDKEIGIFRTSFDKSTSTVDVRIMHMDWKCGKLIVTGNNITCRKDGKGYKLKYKDVPSVPEHILRMAVDIAEKKVLTDTLGGGWW